MFFLLPFGNDRRTSRFPAVTYSLIAANFIMFLWLLPLDRPSVINAFGVFPQHPTLRNMITSMFVHVNVWHLAWNMLFLWLFGPNVEDALGRLEYTIFYLGSGLAASFLHVVMVHGLASAANVPVVGASGAIAGILGIFAIRFYKTRIRVFWCFGILIYPLRWGSFTVPAVVGLGIWFLYQFGAGVYSIAHQTAGGVAYWAHIGGMVFGMILASALKMGSEGSKEYLMADARSSIERGTTWDALENLHALLERDPCNADAHAELAKTYTIQQNRDRAIPHYQRGVDLYLDRGEREKAAACYAEMVNNFRDAELDLRSEFQIARYLMETACHQPALKLFQSIFFTHPGTPEAEVCLMKAGDLCLDYFADPQRAAWCYERFLCEYPESTYRVMVEKSLDEAKKKLGRR